jgi:hypothetical protein
MPNALNVEKLADKTCLFLKIIKRKLQIPPQTGIFW